MQAKCGDGHDHAKQQQLHTRITCTRLPMTREIGRRGVNETSQYHLRSHSIDNALSSLAVEAQRVTGEARLEVLRPGVLVHQIIHQRDRQSANASTYAPHHEHHSHHLHHSGLASCACAEDRMELGAKMFKAEAEIGRVRLVGEGSRG